MDSGYLKRPSVPKSHSAIKESEAQQVRGEPRCLGQRAVMAVLIQQQDSYGAQISFSINGNFNSSDPVRASIPEQLPLDHS